MSNEVVRRLAAKGQRDADPSYVNNRRHPLHPTNLPLTLERAETYFDLQIEQAADDIDHELFLVIFRR